MAPKSCLLGFIATFLLSLSVFPLYFYSYVFMTITETIHSIIFDIASVLPR